MTQGRSLRERSVLRPPKCFCQRITFVNFLIVFTNGFWYYRSTTEELDDFSDVLSKLLPWTHSRPQLWIGNTVTRSWIRSKRFRKLTLPIHNWSLEWLHERSLRERSVRRPPKCFCQPSTAKHLCELSDRFHERLSVLPIHNWAPKWFDREMERILCRVCVVLCRGSRTLFSPWLRTRAIVIIRKLSLVLRNWASYPGIFTWHCIFSCVSKTTMYKCRKSSRSHAEFPSSASPRH